MTMKPLDKTMSARDVVAQLADGMTIGIGGWGPRRKPMALVREIARSNLKDLTIVAYGGADVGLLCAADKVRKVVFGFVSLDVIPLEPHFRRAREQGRVDVLELDEGMLQLGLRAAAARLPFLPTRAGRHRAARSRAATAHRAIAVRRRRDAARDARDRPRRRAAARERGRPDGQHAHRRPRSVLRCVDGAGRTALLRVGGNGRRIARERRPRRRQTQPVRTLARQRRRACAGRRAPTSCAPAYGWDLPHLRAYCASAEDDAKTTAYLRDVVGRTNAGTSKASAACRT